DEDILDAVARPGLNLDIAEDAGQPPHVLVLGVRVGGPLEDPYRKDIASESGDPRQVELVAESAAPDGAEPYAVDPDGGVDLDAVEAEARVVAEVLAESECGDVVADQVLVGDMRRVHRERITHVRVPRSPGPAVGEGPVSGHL